MKKIFLFFIFSLSLFASDAVVNSWQGGLCPETYHYGGYYYYNASNTHSGASLNDITDVLNHGTAPEHYLYDSAYCQNVYNVYTDDSTNNANMWHYNSRVSDSCPSGQVFDDNTLTCITSCPSGYKQDPNNSENCIPDCTQNLPTLANPPLGWSVYTDINSSISCQNKAETDNHLYNDFSFSSMTDDRGCVYNACYINEFDPEPCVNENDPIAHLPQGYIFKGIASSDVVCNSLVDGTYYLNSQYYPVHNNCPSDNSVFCYLKKGLDNNENGLDVNESNQTYPDGTIDPLNLPNVDTNNSNVNHYDFNSSSQSNNLLTQLNNSLKDFVSQSEKQVKTNFDFRTKNDNSNNQKLLNSFNSNTNKIKDSISGVSSKLDTLIGDTVDKSSAVLSDVANIHLSDFNYSSDLDSNFSKSLSADEIANSVGNQFSDFSDKATTAILDAFNNIDYGVLDFFSVSNYDFQDYYLPEIHFLTATFSGKLMDASFLNSLPWSYLRLALLLATLLAGVKYILDRLF